MSFSGYRSNPPRSVQVIVGGLLAWVCAIGGMLLIAPEYHRALTMKESPDTMSYGTLVNRGLVDNAYVRLTDVRLTDVRLHQQIDEQDVADLMGLMLPDEDESELSEREQRRRSMHRGMQMFRAAAVASAVPLQVYPEGQDPDAIEPRVLVLPANQPLAAHQIETTGSLVGRVSIDEGSGLAMRMAAQFGHGEVVEATGQATYHFEPLAEPPSLDYASSWYWLTGLGVAVGLVLCGSGGPSLVCCLAFHGPSLISLLGFPLRYGRGNHATRALYVIVGLGLMSYGYQMTVGAGKIGDIDGSEILVGLGFVPTFVGFGAVLGAVTNFAVERLDISLESSRPNPRRKKMSLKEACSLEPLDAEKPNAYADPKFVSFTQSVHGPPLDHVTEPLATMEFGTPVRYDMTVGTQQHGVSLSLGCRDMVVADVRHHEGDVKVRFLSVLDDGLVVATHDRGHEHLPAKRFGTAAMLLVADESDPLDLISCHLELVAEMAEKRNARVTELESDEIKHVYRYADRCIAGVMAQYGDALLEVDDAEHGRFHYPPRPVPELAGV